MTNQETFETQYFKMSIIGIINLLEQRIEINPTAFEKLNNQTYEQLENYRDNLLSLYNKSISILELSKNL